jgi:flagellar biosynthesis protein FlhG
MHFADFKLGHGEQASRRVPNQAVQVIAVTSGNPGAGKTHIAMNIAQALSLAGRRTLLLDADMGKSNIGKLFGLSHEFTLFDVLEGNKNLDDVMITGPDGILVMAGAYGMSQLAGLDRWECAGLVRAFSEITTPVDALVIDAASGGSECVASLCRAAGEIIVAVCADDVSVNAAATLIESMQQTSGIKRFRILPNRVASASEASEVFSRMLISLSENHDVMLTCCGFIPEDRHIAEAASSGQTVTSAFPRCRAAMALKNLASQIVKWPCSGLAGGHLEFFVERLIQNENINTEVRS